MNGSVFIFSFFIHLLVVNMKALDLGKLILYLTALLNLFIVSRSFLAESWASLMYIKIGIVWLIFLFCRPLISFSHCDVPASVQSQCWKGVGIVDSPALLLTSMGLLQMFLLLG